MKIVWDTNVLVSGLLTPFGPSGEIVRMVSAGELILCINGNTSISDGSKHNQIRDTQLVN